MIFSIDTNVVIYALNRGDPRHALAKQILAVALRRGVPVPRQVLGELLNVAQRRQMLSMARVRKAIEVMIRRLSILPVEDDHLRRASLFAERHRLQFFDALLAITASAAGARYLLTYDMQDGFDIEGVRIVHPSHSANDELVGGLLTAR